MATITSLTLTRNEAKNITECLASVAPIVDRMVVMDNFSPDGSRELAEAAGAEVWQDEGDYRARFALGVSELTHIDTDWILFIDADERLTEESRRELKEMCDRYAGDPEVTGIVVRYRTNFLGRDLRHGGFYPLKKLRVFKPGCFRMEQLELDSHILLTRGRSVEMKTDLLHMDFKGLSNWVTRHNNYAERAAKDFFHKRDGAETVDTKGLEPTARVKRLLKYGVYYKLPGGLRAHLFYIYCYWLRLGFLDGRPGKIYAFLHSYWYRYLVDAYIYEKENAAKQPQERSSVK